MLPIPDGKKQAPICAGVVIPYAGPYKNIGYIKHNCNLGYHCRTRTKANGIDRTMKKKISKSRAIKHKRNLTVKCC